LGYTFLVARGVKENVEFNCYVRIQTSLKQAKGVKENVKLNCYVGYRHLYVYTFILNTEKSNKNVQYH
jgi:hypothetical protein